MPAPSAIPSSRACRLLFAAALSLLLNAALFFGFIRECGPTIHALCKSARTASTVSIQRALPGPRS